MTRMELINIKNEYILYAGNCSQVSVHNLKF